MKGKTLNDTHIRHIRKAGQDDGVSIYGLLLEAREAIGLTNRFVQKPYQDWVVEQCAIGNAWVIDSGGKVIAAMIMDQAEISYLVVAEEYRGKGICSQLLCYAKTLGSELAVEAKKDNEAMIKALLANGFEQFDRSRTENMFSFIWKTEVEKT